MGVSTKPGQTLLTRILSLAVLRAGKEKGQVMMGVEEDLEDRERQKGEKWLTGAPGQSQYGMLGACVCCVVRAGDVGGDGSYVDD